MIKRVKPPAAAVDAFVDELGRVHFRPTLTTSAWAKDFTEIQARFLRGQIVVTNPVARLALALIALEAVIPQDDLERALLACAHPYRYSNCAVIEWKSADGRWERRFLSSFTTLLLTPKTVQEISGQKIGGAITEAACAAFPHSADPLRHLCLRATAWASEFLPGTLAAHVLRLAPMAALPTSALVRRQTGLALVNPDKTSADRTLARTVVGGALELFHYMVTDKGSAWAIVELEEACCHTSNLARAEDKNAMLGECRSLLLRLADADSISALLLAWAADLIESGTRGEPDISPKTIHKYVRAVARALHAELGGKDFLNWDAESFAAAYTRIIAAALSGNRKSVRSGLSSWHSFLMRWLDAPPLGKRLHESIEESVPAAEVVWPREANRILAWLEQTRTAIDPKGLVDTTYHGENASDTHAVESRPGDIATTTATDERLVEQLIVAFHLISGARLRASELLHLRIHSLRFYDHSPIIEVEIAPMLRDGKLKSGSSKRVLKYSEPHVCAVLRQWHNRRIQEGALNRDFLFGDPYHPDRVYRLGALYSEINHLTRVATGSRDASLHSWGHAWASLAIEREFTSDSKVDIEPLDLIATAMGQLSSATTLKHYTHLYEPGLRHHLDKLLGRSNLNSKVIGVWTGLKATTLRQRAFIAGKSWSEYAHLAISDCARQVELPCVSTGLSLCEPESPLAGCLKDDTTYELVLVALADIARGLGRAVVASRCRRSPAWIDCICLAANEALLRLRFTVLCNADGRTARYQTLVASLSQPLPGLDFSRIDQAKFHSVRRNLSSLPKSEVSRLISAWESSFGGNYLNLADPVAAEVLFRGLHMLGVPDHCLALSISNDLDDPLKPELIREAALQICFRNAYSRDALVEYKRPRRGRPEDYLIWMSSPINESEIPAPAAASITGFNALMLAMSIFHRMEESPWE